MARSLQREGPWFTSPRHSCPLPLLLDGGQRGAARHSLLGILHPNQRKYLECIGEVQGGLSFAFLPWQQK